MTETAGPVSADDIVVACVVENRPDWFQKAFNLAFSLRQFGGAAAGATFRALFVGAVDEQFRRDLATLDVECRVVEKFPSPYPHTNKLRMFEDFAADPKAALVALDCDVVVVGDF